MPSTGLHGPFALTEDSIDESVTHTAPGAYALGKTRDGTFYIRYVGRADTDISSHLEDHVGSYLQFKFDYFSSAKAAFEKECHLFHDFTPPDNKIHPARPKGTNWTCPRCRVFD